MQPEANGRHDIIGRYLGGSRRMGGCPAHRNLWKISLYLYSSKAEQVRIIDSDVFPRNFCSGCEHAHIKLLLHTAPANTKRDGMVYTCVFNTPAEFVTFKC